VTTASDSSAQPFFSVVTPSFNQGAFIEQTIRSVLDQNYPAFEHIVYDGGSTDQTVSVLKRYSHLQWVSEKDGGQSAALNKGFRKARGEVVAWINSDDWYEPGAFAAVAQFFSKHPDRNVVMGDCRCVDAAGKEIGIVINHERGFNYIRAYWKSAAIPAQPAVFFRRRLLDECGLLDESLHYGMDYDLWLRFARNHHFYHINQLVANYRFHTAAKGGDGDWNKFKPEWRRVYDRHCPGFCGRRLIAKWRGKA
jgi:glycosyltransferase involved in cell wall biosynthesis